MQKKNAWLFVRMGDFIKNKATEGFLGILLPPRLQLIIGTDVGNYSFLRILYVFPCKTPIQRTNKQRLACRIKLLFYLFFLSTRVIL